jgi:biotin carboxyl carrier protein
MQLQYQVGDRLLSVAVDERDTETVVVVDGRELIVDDVDVGERFITLRIDGRTHRLLYYRAGAHVHVACAGHAFELVPADEARDEVADGDAGFTPEVSSPMPGKVLDVLVTAGDVVEVDQPLVMLEAMKMEQTVRSRAAARVTDVRVAAGAMVGPGEILVVLEEIEER